MQDVGEHQAPGGRAILQTQLDQTAQRSVVRHGGHPACHAEGVTGGPVSGTSSSDGPREQPALRAQVLGAHAVVVEVEQHGTPVQTAGNQGS